MPYVDPEKRRETNREYQRRYRERHRLDPTRQAAARRVNRRDWAPGEHEKAEASRASTMSCESCGGPPSSKHGWVADHCRTTGRFRGSLCHGCNVALGMLGESADRAERLAAYIRRRVVPLKN